MKGERITPYIFLTPSILVLTAFLFLPIAVSLGLMFYEWDILSPPRFVGLRNFMRLLDDEVFWISLKNTLYFTLGSVPLSVFPALLLAWVLEREWFKFPGFIEVVYFLPVVSGWVEAAIIWRWLLHRDYGLINYLLSLVGLPPVAWLRDPNIIMNTIILVHAWKLVGYNAVILRTAFKSVPREIINQALVDGASAFDMFRSIEVPLIMPVLYFTLVINTIYSFQVFPQVYVLTFGGPGYSSYVMVFYTYLMVFRFRQAGYATVIAFVLFLLMFTLTILYKKMIGKEVRY